MEKVLARSIPPSGPLHSFEAQALGEIGARRLEEFRGYTQGWDGDSGRQLSAKSEKEMVEFLRRALPLISSQPSVFLTRAGNVQLAWETRGGQRIEIEFAGGKIEYYFEGFGEGEASADEFCAILSKHE